MFGQSIVTKASDLSVQIALVDSNKPATSTLLALILNNGTSGIYQQINISFTKSSTDTQKPASLNLANTDIADFEGVENNFVLDNSEIDNGIFKLVSYEGVMLDYSNTLVVDLTHFTTPELGECTVSGENYDECYIKIDFFSDEGTTLVESTGAAYRIEDDTPSLSFSISGVGSGVANNGITTNFATDFNRVDFGSLAIATPKFGAQKLTVKSNSPDGYQVKMHLDGYIEGMYPAYKIDPFSPTDVSWEEPGPWKVPYGGKCNPQCTDTGWVGANTTDTRNGGKPSGAGEFGPVSSARHVVMESSGRDTGTDVYVTYGIEVNQNQPPDNYAGTLIYEIIPTY